MLRVEAPLKKVKKYFECYVLGLLVLPGRKTCPRMALNLGISHDKLYRFVSKAAALVPIFPSIFIVCINHFSRRCKGFLIIDDTAISKVFDRAIEGIGYVYNSAIGRPERGFSIVVLAWSNGLVTIPIAFKCWYSKNLVSANDYNTKIVLAQELIISYAQKVSFKYLLADGLYCSKAMILFFNDHNIKFVMRIASNRKVKIKGQSYQIKNHPLLKLLRNKRSVTCRALWGETKIFITAQKRQGKWGDWNIVYLASNMRVESREYLVIYNQRWEIEKMFRTIKQKIGLAHCSARAAKKQQAHIYAVFFAYIFLQHEKLKENEPNVEEVVKALHSAKLDDVRGRITAFNQNFAYVA